MKNMMLGYINTRKDDDHMWNEIEQMYIASDDTGFNPALKITDLLTEEEIIEARRRIDELFNND